MKPLYINVMGEERLLRLKVTDEDTHTAVQRFLSDNRLSVLEMIWDEMVNNNLLVEVERTEGDIEWYSPNSDKIATCASCDELVHVDDSIIKGDRVTHVECAAY